MDATCTSGYRPVGDIALAAFLVAKGYTLRGIRQVEGKGLFLFEDTREMNEAILLFYNRKAAVEPLTFAETFRDLKAAVRAA